MATVVVGYVPKPEGEAALNRAIEEAQLRGAKLVVVSCHRGGSEFDGDVQAQPRRSWTRSESSSPAPASSTTSASWSAASSRPRT